jgi:cell division protein FtsL
MKKETKMFSTLEKTLFTLVYTAAVIVIAMDILVWRAI